MVVALSAGRQVGVGGNVSVVWTHNTGGLPDDGGEGRFPAEQTKGLSIVTSRELGAERRTGLLPGEGGLQVLSPPVDAGRRLRGQGLI